MIGVTRNQKDIKNLDQFKGKYKLFYGDVTKEATINKIFNYLKINKIKLTGLVNNAGIRQRKKFEKITKKDFVKVLDNNLISPFIITQKFFFIKFIWCITTIIVNLTFVHHSPRQIKIIMSNFLNLI